MFPGCKIHEQVKLPIFLVFFIVNNDNVMAVTKRQITIGQYFFPRTASFPDYGWNADAHSLAEPIYDEIILLPQEKQQQQQHQNVVEQKEKGRIYPIPTRIFHKNRFNSPRAIRPSERQTFHHKHSATFGMPGGTNATYIAVPQDGAMTDIHIKMNVDDSDDIHATVINEAPGAMMSPDRQHRYGGYAGRVVIDLTSNDSTEVTEAQPRMSHRLLKSSKSPEASGIFQTNASLSQNADKEAKIHSFRSNMEIFNQILKVRKDIDGLRRDIRGVKQLVQQIGINGKLSESIPITPQTDGTLLEHAVADTNVRNHQVFRDVTPKYGAGNMTAEPTYIVVSRTASTINPSVRSRLRANVEAPALREDELKGSVIGQDVYLRNSTNLVVGAAQRIFPQRTSIAEASRKKQSLKILPVKDQSGSDPGLHLINDPNKTVRLSSAVQVTDDRSKSGKILQKQAVPDGKAKNAVFSDEERKVFQFHAPTTAKTEFFATAPSLSSEKESLGIYATQAYRPFSSTRYTARSRISFGKQMRKLIIFTTTPTSPTARQSRDPLPAKQIAGDALPQVTLSAVVPAVKNALPSEIGSSDATDPFNSTAVILGFASLTPPESWDQADATVPPSPTTVSFHPSSPLSTATSVTTATATVTTTLTTTTISHPTAPRIIPPTAITERITTRSTATLVPLKSHFIGNNFDDIFVPWFNDPQLTLWPEGLFQRG